MVFTYEDYVFFQKMRQEMRQILQQAISRLDERERSRKQLWETPEIHQPEIVKSELKSVETSEPSLEIFVEQVVCDLNQKDLSIKTADQGDTVRVGKKLRSLTSALASGYLQNFWHRKPVEFVHYPLVRVVTDEKRPNRFSLASHVWNPGGRYQNDGNVKVINTDTNLNKIFIDDGVRLFIDGASNIGKQHLSMPTPRGDRVWEPGGLCVDYVTWKWLKEVYKLESGMIFPKFLLIESPSAMKSDMDKLCHSYGTRCMELKRFVCFTIDGNQVQKWVSTNLSGYENEMLLLGNHGERVGKRSSRSVLLELCVWFLLFELVIHLCDAKHEEAAFRSHQAHEAIQFFKRVRSFQAIESMFSDEFEKPLVDAFSVFYKGESPGFIEVSLAFVIAKSEENITSVVEEGTIANNTLRLGHKEYSNVLIKGQKHELELLTFLMSFLMLLKDVDGRSYNEIDPFSDFHLEDKVSLYGGCKGSMRVLVSNTVKRKLSVDEEDIQSGKYSSSDNVGSPASLANSSTKDGMKKSARSSVEKGFGKQRCAKKEELVVKVIDDNYRSEGNTIGVEEFPSMVFIKIHVVGIISDLPSKVVGLTDNIDGNAFKLLKYGTVWFGKIACEFHLWDPGGHLFDLHFTETKLTGVKVDVIRIIHLECKLLMYQFGKSTSQFHSWDPGGLTVTMKTPLDSLLLMELAAMVYFFHLEDKVVLQRGSIDKHQRAMAQGSKRPCRGIKGKLVDKRFWMVESVSYTFYVVVLVSCETRHVFNGPETL